MQSILVFIDGTICDDRHRLHPLGTPDFTGRDAVLKDVPVLGSVECLRMLAGSYSIVYLGARDPAELHETRDWLKQSGFPEGAVYLAPSQERRLEIVRELCRLHRFIAGIGDRWDDNELHLEAGCVSIILKEYEGNWETVSRHVPRANSDSRGGLV